MTGFPAAVTAGVAGNFTVTADDPYGNVATGYAGTVEFSSGDSQAGLPATYTFVAADNGKHTFSATFNTVGIQYLKAADTVASSISGTESGIIVAAASDGWQGYASTRSTPLYPRSRPSRWGRFSGRPRSTSTRNTTAATS